MKNTFKVLLIIDFSEEYGRALLRGIGEINVPEEVAIMGVDNDEVLCNLLQPPLSRYFKSRKQISPLAYRKKFAVHKAMFVDSI